MDLDSNVDSPPLLHTEEDDDPPIPVGRIQFSTWKTFKHHIPRFLITLLVDLIAPLVVYLIAQKRIRPVYALFLAGIPPLIMVIIKAVTSRTFDALGFVIFTAFLASAIAAIITHNPVILLLEKSLVTGIIAIIFGITLIPFHYCDYRCQIRPLAYYFYQDLVPTKRKEVGLPDIIFDNEEAPIGEQSFDTYEDFLVQKLSHKQEVCQVYEWIYAHCSSFRHACYIITSIWSAGLLSEFLARTFLILIQLPTNKIFIYGHIILSLITSLLIVLTVICIAIERKRTLKTIEEWKNEYLNIQEQSSHVSLSSVNLIDTPS